MPTTEQVRAQWDEFAAEYAEWAERTSSTMARHVLMAMQGDRCRRLLEVGCGPGLAAKLALDVIPPDAEITVTDLAPNMIALAKQRLAGTRAKVMVADAEDLPFPDASFDRVLANLNWMLVPDPDRAAKQMFRVLEPGGLVGLSIWGRPEASQWMTLAPMAARDLGIELPKPERTGFHLMPTAVDRLRAVGFADVWTWSYPMVLSFRDGESFAKGIFEASPRQRREFVNLAAGDRERLFAEVARRADAVLSQGRPISLDILCLVAKKPS